MSEYEGGCVAPALHVLQLVVGDWSDDGHGKTSTVVVHSELDRGLLSAAYTHGAQVQGHDVQKHCRDYEDGEIPKQLLLSVDAGVKALGGQIDFDKYSDYGYDAEGNLLGIDEELDDELYISADDYAGLWIAIANIGAGRIVARPVEKEQTIDIHIGGYGLFY